MTQTQKLLTQAAAHHQAGRLQQAAELYRRILEKDPQNARIIHLLALVARDSGNHQAAAQLLRKAISVDPGQATYYFDLSVVLHHLRQQDAAIKAVRHALAMQPVYPEAHSNLACLLSNRGEHEAALQHCKQALATRPDYADAWYNQAIAYRGQNRLLQAIDSYRQALRFRPDGTHIWNNLGNTLMDSGNLEEATSCFEKVLSLQPGNAATYSNLLFLQASMARLSCEDMLAAHREWDRRFGGRGKAARFDWPRGGDTPAAAGKRLKIGYISGDFRNHVVCRFFEPVLAARNRADFEVYCYAEVPRPDAVTQRIQALSDGGRFTSGVPDEVLADQIHDDGIDILVDLSGHTGNNRLGALAYRPAPVQATYIGYCATTGLEAIDYWITDGVLHPSETEERTSEEIWRLDHCWLCYQPAPDAPDVELPDPGRPVTFTSFNNLSKLTDEVIETWSRILHEVAGSRLLLKTKQFHDPGLRQQITEKFSARDIPADRLLLQGSARDYLHAYHDVDIALDPFPRTGGGTTADALWMGVPVITLAGKRYIERQGVSMLTALDRSEWIAENKEDYVRKAVALALDAELRRKMRGSQRQRMRDSQLCDARGLSSELEKAYRTMWQRYLGAANH